MVHLDMDAFFASVEELTRPTLAGRPVLVGGLGGRGVVAGASYAAREFGARSAMPMHQARRLVGATAVVLPPRGSVYRLVSERVFGIVRQEVPTIEMLSFDEAFGEPEGLAGARAADAAEFGERLRARIQSEVGLTASVGIGSGKQIAKIASGMAKPDGLMAITPSSELRFLHDLPVRKLWGIGPVSGDKLARLGIDTIGDFAAMSPIEVSSVLGATLGPALHRLAQGIDDRPVAERASAKQISSETTLAQDIVDLPNLRKEITKIAADAHRRLVSDGRGARTVVVKVKKSDMSILTRSATLAGASVDLEALTAAAQRLALDPMEIGPIRLVGVSFSGLTALQQFSLDFSESEVSESAEGVVDSPATSGDSDSEPPVVEDTPPDEDEWRTGLDVAHDEYGHGWIQGSGHGVVTVRFETRATGPGRAQTFRLPTDVLRRADPLDSLAW